MTPQQSSRRILPSADSIKAIGGLVAVGIGVVAVAIVAIVALNKDTQTAATITGSAAGVIASIVGAFFGVKIGSDQAKDANAKKDQQAAKAQVYALHVPHDIADAVEAAAAKAAEAIR
jgi:hypothetical protein